MDSLRARKLRCAVSCMSLGAGIGCWRRARRLLGRRRQTIYFGCADLTMRSALEREDSIINVGSVTYHEVIIIHV